MISATCSWPTHCAISDWQTQLTRFPIFSNRSLSCSSLPIAPCMLWAKDSCWRSGGSFSGILGQESCCQSLPCAAAATGCCAPGLLLPGHWQAVCWRWSSSVLSVIGPTVIGAGRFRQRPVVWCLELCRASARTAEGGMPLCWALGWRFNYSRAPLSFAFFFSALSCFSCRC